MSGREVHGVYTGIAGGHIEGINSRGVVAVTGKDREITKEDVDRVIDAAKAIVIPMDREVLHVIPQEFIVDAAGRASRTPSAWSACAWRPRPTSSPGRSPRRRTS